MNMNQTALKSVILSFKQVLRTSHLFCFADSTGQERNTNIISIVLVRNKLSLELSHLVVYKSYSNFYKALKKSYNVCMALEFCYFHFYSSITERSLLVQMYILSLHPLEILIQGLKLTFLKPKHMWHKRANKDRVMVKSFSLATLSSHINGPKDILDTSNEIKRGKENRAFTEGSNTVMIVRMMPSHNHLLQY